MSTPIRTRFAPSPTGFLHVGGIRTALFAYLVARQSGGSFILRLEDTDQKREVAGSREHLIASLNALGLTYDEGPDIGGVYGPYVQSERLDIYKRWVQELVDAGRAYADPYTAEEIQAFRDDAVREKRAFLYRDHRPENPPAWDGSQPLRFKSDPKNYTYHDVVMGDVTTNPEVVDDFILIKSDGYPTYNFAHIVDDAEMKITHIIRGQEFISSMPNFLALYEALGFEMNPRRDGADISGRQLPIFAHMPPVLNEQGNKKLGKRDGAKDVLDYIRDGYLPETMVGFIATLGWNDGTEQELFSREELIEKFSLDRVQRSGARFDEQRLLWMNGQWIRRLELDDLYERVRPYWPESAEEASDEYRKHVLSLIQDRLKTLAEVGMMTRYFFEEPAIDETLISGNKQLAKLTDDERRSLLQAAHDALENSEWTPEAIQDTLNHLLETTGQKPGILFSLVRIATTWAPFSPQLNDTLALIGKEKTLARIQQALSL